MAGHNPTKYIVIKVTDYLIFLLYYKNYRQFETAGKIFENIVMSLSFRKGKLWVTRGHKAAGPVDAGQPGRRRNRAYRGYPFREMDISLFTFEETGFFVLENEANLINIFEIFD
jgi:hypothetical protein